ncbi:hypothetical protein [Cellulomonas chengniuliangii]|uniref:hypothetical protein n=1 Tax=Cellulomonas chengniuliangii TaxID=2968084 RepID=UPI0027DF2BEE|nr:hypothetical protein [Cellulomonas chengniuliangii]
MAFAAPDDEPPVDDPLDDDPLDDALDDPPDDEPPDVDEPDVLGAVEVLVLESLDAELDDDDGLAGDDEVFVLRESLR